MFTLIDPEFVRGMEMLRGGVFDRKHFTLRAGASVVRTSFLKGDEVVPSTSTLAGSRALGKGLAVAV